MTGTCVCCGRVTKVGGTPLMCLGCGHTCNPSRSMHGATHGRDAHELESYVDQWGYIAWRLPPGDGQLTLDLGGAA